MGIVSISGGAVAIPDSGTVLAAGGTFGSVIGHVLSVRVILNGLTHGASEDLDFLLVGPNNRAFALWTDASLSTQNTATFTIADSATTYLPNTRAGGGTYRPASYVNELFEETSANWANGVNTDGLIG